MKPGGTTVSDPAPTDGMTDTSSAARNSGPSLRIGSPLWSAGCRRGDDAENVSRRRIRQHRAKPLRQTAKRAKPRRCGEGRRWFQTVSGAKSPRPAGSGRAGMSAATSRRLLEDAGDVGEAGVASGHQREQAVRAGEAGEREEPTGVAEHVHVLDPAEHVPVVAQAAS